MKRVISFGEYVFPDTIPERGAVLSTNFGDAVPRTNRLPGMDGGFDTYGDDPAAREIGTVRARFVLVADTPEAMAAARDSVMGMAGYGRAMLTVETGAGDQRWTWAKVNHITLPTEPDAFADRIAEVTVHFQVALPLWFSTNADSPQEEACSGTSTEFTVTNGGTAAAIPVITVAPTTALASGVIIQRIVDSVIVDEVDYDTALTDSDVLVIDAQKLTVRKNDVDAYGTDFEALHPAWMRLLPGDNAIKVILGGGEAADVEFSWADAWY